MVMRVKNKGGRRALFDDKKAIELLSGGKGSKEADSYVSDES